MNKLAVITPASTELRKLGRQIEDQYRKSQTGLLHCIALGDLVAEARKVVSTVDTTRPRGGGEDTAGTGLKAWLAEFAPNVPRSTAYRFEDMSENVRAEMRIGKRVSVARIIMGEVKDAKSLALLEKMADFVGGKTQRTLLIGIGQPDAKIGGKRDAKTKPPTEEERRNAWLQDARQRSIATFSGLHDLEERWKILDDVELSVAIADSEAFLRDAKAWLRTPKPARAALDVEKLLQTAAAADQGGKQS